MYPHPSFIHSYYFCFSSSLFFFYLFFICIVGLTAGQLNHLIYQDVFELLQMGWRVPKPCIIHMIVKSFLRWEARVGTMTHIKNKQNLAWGSVYSMLKITIGVSRLVGMFHSLAILSPCSVLFFFRICVCTIFMIGWSPVFYNSCFKPVFLFISMIFWCK